MQSADGERASFIDLTLKKLYKLLIYDTVMKSLFPLTGTYAGTIITYALIVEVAKY